MLKIFKKNIKTMNIKKATNSQLSTTESNKYTHTHTHTCKQPEQEQNHRYGDHSEDYQLGDKEENEGEGTEFRKHKW